MGRDGDRGETMVGQRQREGEEERNVEMGLKPTITATVSTLDSTIATAWDT